MNFRITKCVLSRITNINDIDDITLFVIMENKGDDIMLINDNYV